MVPKPRFCTMYAFILSLDSVPLKNNLLSTPAHTPILSCPAATTPADSAAVSPFCTHNTFEMAKKRKKISLQDELQIINDVDKQQSQKSLDFPERLSTPSWKTGNHFWGNRKMADFQWSGLGFGELATQKLRKLCFCSSETHFLRTFRWKVRCSGSALSSWHSFLIVLISSAAKGGWITSKHAKESC